MSDAKLFTTLKAAALKATRGKWRSTTSSVMDQDGNEIVVGQELWNAKSDHPRCRHTYEIQADLDYIAAASPENVLRLIALATSRH